MLLAFSACAGQPSATSAPTIANDGQEQFQTTCMGCHDEPDPPAPDFSRPLAPSLAGKALRAVIEHQMPPVDSESNTELDGARREMIIRWLCAKTGRDAVSCAGIADYATDPQRMRSGRAILTTAKRISGREVGPQTAQVMSMSTPDLRDVRAFASVLIVAVDSCAAKPEERVLGVWLPTRAVTAAQSSTRDPQQCVQRVLQRGLAPPAPGGR